MMDDAVRKISDVNGLWIIFQQKNPPPPFSQDEIFVTASLKNWNIVPHPLFYQMIYRYSQQAYNQAHTVLWQTDLHCFGFPCWEDNFTLWSSVEFDEFDAPLLITTTASIKISGALTDSPWIGSDSYISISMSPTGCVGGRTAMFQLVC